jgi:hypothetical protein
MEIFLDHVCAEFELCSCGICSGCCESDHPYNPHAIWDGKDMAAIQMLLQDLREDGAPVAQWTILPDGSPQLQVWGKVIERGDTLMRELDTARVISARLGVL